MRLPSRLSAIAATLLALAAFGEVGSAPLVQTADATTMQGTAVTATADFERGTNSGAIATGDAGSATPWSTASYGARPSEAIYDNRYAAHGLLAAKLTPGKGNAQAYLSWRGAFGIKTDYYGRAYVRLPAYPTGGNDNIIRALDSVGRLGWGISLTTAGKLNLFDSTLTTRAASTASLSTSRWNRIEWHAINSTSAGSLEVKIFTNADSTTPDETVRFTNRDTRANTEDIWFRVARSGYSIWYDDLVVGAAAYPGPASTSAPTPAPSPTPTPAPTPAPTPTPSAATLNVKDYGAVGDGGTDDTAAIQRALDAGAGKQVLVPAGTYKVGPLWERTSTTINLDSGARLLLAPGSNANLITVTATGASVIGSGTLDGNRAAQTRGAAIGVGGANGVTIRGVRVVNTAQCGIYATNASNLTVSGVTVAGTDYVGILIEALTRDIAGLVIENSRVDRSSQGASIVESGIVVHHGPTSNLLGVRVSNNTIVMPRGPLDENAVAMEIYGGTDGAVIRDNVTTGGAIGITLAGTTGGLLTGNTVSGAKTYGIEVAHASNGSTVSSNTVQCAGYTSEGVVLDDASAGNAVSGNTISGCVDRGVTVNTGSDRTTISGNHVGQSGGYAVEVLRSRLVAVADNVLDGGGSALKGVVAEASPGMTATGNRISRFTTRGVLLYRSDQSTVANNVVSQSKGYAVHVISAGGVTVTRNTLDGASAAPKGLVLDTSSDVTISENAFSDFTQHGVLLCATSPTVLDRIFIRRNTFANTGTAYGTQLTGGATLGEVVLSDNRVT